MAFFIKGTVIKGDGYGKKIGYPTANLDIYPEALPVGLKEGIYAGTASIVSRGILDTYTYRAGIVIGREGKVEAHLVGYNGDLYGREISIEIKKFLRKYKKFETEEELKAQIKKDLEQC